VLTSIAKYYNSQIKHIEKYVKLRKLTDSMISDNIIGYAGFNDLPNLLKIMPADKLIEFGMAKLNDKGELRCVFFNRLMFPIKYLNKIVGFSGRAVTKEGEEYGKYMNTAETPYFKKSLILYGLNTQAILMKQYIIIVEGQIDCLRMHSIGFTNTVATIGTALTVDHIDYLKHITRKVVLLYDGDEAGKLACIRATKLFKEAELRYPRIVNLPDELDPDEFILTTNNAKEKLGDLIEKADLIHIPVEHKRELVKKEYENTDDIKANIVEIIDSIIGLNKHNKAKCPFHDEKTASFSVSPAKKVFKCFGCGASGDVISFVMKYYNLSYSQAVDKLRGK